MTGEYKYKGVTEQILWKYVYCITKTDLEPDHVQVFWKHKCFGNISQLETRPLIG